MSTSGEILLIDKPKGITSFDVIRVLRKKLGVKKIGHAGTLDPFATGLLIVGVGAWTKRMKEFETLPKTYLMDVRFGMRTDTGDPEGKILEEREVLFSNSRELENKEKEGAQKISLKQVEEVLAKMEGELELPIPKYSAIKHKGVPLYKYARRGIEVEEKLRTTKIFYLKLLKIIPELEYIIAQIEMKAEKGTYARAVAEEIGRRLNVPAMLQDLRRTKIGDIDVSDAKRIEEIQ